MAVKVLRPDLAAALGPDRFLREIEIAAQLHHPHILPLYDSGEADGFLYYVMPYEEGQSLREKLAKEGELPVTEAVRLLRDVVDALAHAHKHGVVHRDIKPDNVLLSGRHALVTDFGVAKAVSEATGRQQLTTAGVALGTPAYMAPEQAVAEPHIDHRADIYAVGALAYELLTGRPPFTGRTAQEVLSAHVTETAEPVTKYRETVPPALGQLVMRCLEKKPADRWQSAEELLPQLEALATPSGGVTPTGTAPIAAVRAGRRVNVALLVTGVTVAIAVIGFFGWNSLRRNRPTVTVSNIRQLTRAPEIEYEPAISPDGGEVVYTAGFGLDMHIYVRGLGRGRSLPLTADRPGTQIAPRWAPDGQNIVFFELGADGRTASYLIPRFGGPARTMVPLAAVDALTDDRVAYSTGDSLMVRSLEGGEPTLVVRAPPRPHSAAWSPDGTKLAYVRGNWQFISPAFLGNVAPSSIWIVGVDRGEPVQVTDHPSLNVSPAWLPDGRHLLFVSNRDGARDLYAVRVDGSGRPRGGPVRVTTGLDPHSVSVSADGSTLAYSKFTFRRNVWAIEIPKSGSVSISQAKPVTVGNQIAEEHGVSADGRWLVFDSNLEGNQDIYVVPLEGGEPRRVTTHPGDHFHPDFSPDGSEIVFHSPRHGTRDVFLIGADGGNEV
ncbi:MAG: protein kinase, partial [Gemmatimonadales bacterium]